MVKSTFCAKKVVCKHITTYGWYIRHPSAVSLARTAIMLKNQFSSSSVP